MQSEPSQDCHWKEKSMTSSGIFTRETMRENRRILLQSLQWNSGDLGKSPSELQSGCSTMGSSVSKTGYTCLTIQSYTAWNVISVDFIVELPDSHGYDADVLVMLI